MKIDKRRAFFEFLSIIVAVVLAMTLSEWRQDYNNKKLAKRSYAAILLEIEENRDELVGDSVNVYEDIQYLTEWLRLIYEENKVTEFDLNYTFAMLNNSAMEVAKINQSLSYIPQEDLMEIAEIYLTHEFYSEKGGQVFNYMSDLTSDMGDIESKSFHSKVRVFRFQLSLVLSTMRSYIRDADDLLKAETLRPE